MNRKLIDKLFRSGLRGPNLLVFSDRYYFFILESVGDRLITARAMRRNDDMPLLRNRFSLHYKEIHEHEELVINRLIQYFWNTCQHRTMREECEFDVAGRKRFWPVFMLMLLRR